MFPKIVDTTFENKILDLSQEEYHARTDCAHSSTLKHMLKSPSAYKYYIEHPTKQTKPMVNGSIVHEAVLEGAKFLAKYQVMPEFQGFTAKGEPTTSLLAKDVQRQIKEWTEALPPGSIILSQSSYDDLRWQLDSVMQHRFAMDIIKDSVTEYKKQWRDPSTGIAMISSDDIVNIKNDVWADVKTCSNSDWEQFRRTVESLNYPFQAAMYEQGHIHTRGRGFSDKFWIAIENCAPWQTRVHVVDEFYMKAGKYSYDQAKHDLATSLRNNSWPQAQVILESGKPSFFYTEKFNAVLEWTT